MKTQLVVIIFFFRGKRFNSFLAVLHGRICSTRCLARLCSALSQKPNLPAACSPTGPQNAEPAPARGQCEIKD